MPFSKISNYNDKIRVDCQIGANTATSGLAQYLRYCGSNYATNPSNAAFYIPRNGTLKKFYLSIATNTLDVSMTVKLFKNGTEDSTLGTISAGSTTAIKVNLNVSVAEDDVLAFEVNSSAGTGTIRFQCLYFEVV